ncbi:hypothetical protein FQA39_LY04409 [Lamprigera yunnana]|nr:hypothetical protein FQA39_LY04409 [Lamprigera yunnana]
MKNILNLSNAELQKFLDSIENFVLDVDGVVWNFDREPVEGVLQTLEKLRNLKKKVWFVSNNSAFGHNQMHQRLLQFDPDLPITNVITPCVVMISYLKSINFVKTIFLLGTPAMKQDLIDAGFDVADPVDDVDKNNILDVYNRLGVADNIGAVIFDMNFKNTILDLCKALNCITNNDILYIHGVNEKTFNVDNKWIFGSTVVQDVFSQIVERQPINFSKPDKMMQDYVKEKIGDSGCSKTIFVGDMIESDIMFGKNCDFKTLLVLTGFTKSRDFENFTEDNTPDYYIPSLGHLVDFVATSCIQLAKERIIKYSDTKYNINDFKTGDCETMLLNQTIYYLNKSKSKWISVGLYHPFEFASVLKIFEKSKQYVIFKEEDWIQFRKQRENINKYFQTCDMMWKPRQIGSQTLTFEMIEEKKILRIEDVCGNEVYLGNIGLQHFLDTIRKYIKDCSDSDTSSYSSDEEECKEAVEQNGGDSKTTEEEGGRITKPFS